jgi:cell wall-associated NlpC family hydrolase
VAFDCMGMVTWAQAQIGRTVRDYLELYRKYDVREREVLNQLYRAEADGWRNVAAGDVGDVLVLGTGNRAHHVAVLCGQGRAIHATKSSGIVIHEIEGRARVDRFAGMRVFACVSPA